MIFRQRDMSEQSRSTSETSPNYASILFSTHQTVSDALTGSIMDLCSNFKTHLSLASINGTLANRVDPDQKPSDQGLPCLH